MLRLCLAHRLDQSVVGNFNYIKTMTVENRIKELRWKNEFYLKRWFSNKDRYQPSKIDLDSKIRIYKMGAKILKAFAIFVVILFGATMYFQKGEIADVTFYQLLLAGSIFYLIGFEIQVKASRFEEISSLKKLQESNQE